MHVLYNSYVIVMLAYIHNTAYIKSNDNHTGILTQAYL